MIKLNKNWKKCTLHKKALIKDAIYNLQQSGFKIILVLDDLQKLIGIITDGDIRRGLLAGLNIESSISSIIERKFISINRELSESELKEIFIINDIYQLPLVDKKRKVKGLYISSYLNSEKRIKNKLIILAGGQGKRLRPYTNDIPKPMLKINGKPILEHIIINARLSGIKEIIISVNYLSHKIINYFKDGSHLNVKIDYIKETYPMGTVGSLALLKKLPKDDIIVINGDIISNIDFKNFLTYHNSKKSRATMAVRVFESHETFGFVKTKGVNITGFEEKPIKRSYINAGIYILDPKLLNYLKKFTKKRISCNMPDLFQYAHVQNIKSIIYPFFSSWTDIGNKKDFIQLKKNKKIFN
jgi:dTDP-glucose pyrophosphorylase